MTVSASYTPDQYTGTGDNTELPTTFAFNKSSDVVVTSRVIATGVPTVLTETTHYTVAGGSWEVGSVTPVDGDTDFPETVTWTLERQTAITQETDWVENDDFTAESHERAADKLTFIAQERAERATRSLSIPITDDEDLDLELPSSVDRASTYLGFDEDGEPVALAAPTGSSITTAWSQGLLEDGDAEDGRGTIFGDIVTARGDILVADADPKLSVLPKGTEGQVLTMVDGNDPGWAELAAQAKNYKHGLECNCASSSVTDNFIIEISPGVARDSADAEFITIAAQTDIDIRNSGALGLFSGSVAADTTYHIFIIKKPDGTASAGFSTLLDPTAQLPSGYTMYRRIGSRRSKPAAAELWAFYQDGVATYSKFESTGGITYTETAADTDGHTIDIGIPKDISVLGLVRFQALFDGAGDHAFVGATGVSRSSAPGGGANGLATISSVAAGYCSIEKWMRVEDGNIFVWVTDADTDYWIYPLGWIDFCIE